MWQNPIMFTTDSSLNLVFKVLAIAQYNLGVQNTKIVAIIATNQLRDVIRLPRNDQCSHTWLCTMMIDPISHGNITGA